MNTQTEKMEGKLCYFARVNPKGVADKTIETDVLSGTISTNPLEAYKSLLGDLFLPILDTQDNWGKCQSDQHVEFITGATKFGHTLTEAVASLEGGVCPHTKTRCARTRKR